MVFFHQGKSSTGVVGFTAAASAVIDDWPLEPMAQPTRANALDAVAKTKDLRVTFARVLIAMHPPFSLLYMAIAIPTLCLPNKYSIYVIT